MLQGGRMTMAQLLNVRATVKTANFNFWWKRGGCLMWISEVGGKGGGSPRVDKKILDVNIINLGKGE